MKAALWIRTASVALGVAFSGCGRSDRAETAPVTGMVTLDGKPVVEGTITFESPGTRPANGVIEEGTILNVTTYEPGDGAPVGNHKVAIFAYDPSEPAQDVNENPFQLRVADYLPARYGDPQTSGLTATIESDQENTLTFDLKSQ